MRSLLLLVVLACGWCSSAWAVPVSQADLDARDYARDLSQLVPGTRMTFAELFAGGASAPTASLSQRALAKLEADLRDALGKSPDSAYLLHSLGTVLYHEGNSAEAKAVWSAAAKKDPNLAPADVMAAAQEVFALLVKGENRTAAGRLAEAERRFASNPHFHLVRAEQALRGGDTAEAEKAYRKANELGKGLFITSANLGRLHEIKKDHAGARSFYTEAVQRAPRRPEPWQLLGTFEFRSGNIQSAFDAFRKEHSLDPKSPLPETRLALLSAAARDYIGARHWFRAALALNPPDSSALRVGLSDAQVRLGLVDEAKREITLVLGREQSPPLMFALATIEEALGNHERAGQLYRRALETDPRNGMIQNNLAMLLIRTGGSAAESLQLAEKAMNAHPDSASVMATHACALAYAGHTKDAIHALARTVRHSPSDPWVRYFLGKTLVVTDRAWEAKVHLEGVLILDPKFPRRAEIQTLLAQAK